MRKRKNLQAESQLLNDSTYLQYYNRLYGLALSMFEWKNLPPTIDERYLELALFTKGYCVFFYDEVIGYLTLNCTIGGTLDVYQIPKERVAISPNGYHRNLTNDNSVLIFNDVLHNSGLNDLENYAKRLYNIERTIDVNVNAQKTPVTILCDETQRLTMKNLYMQYDGNEPFIFGDKNIDLKGISSINTNAPFVADKLNVLKKEIFNEALTWLGIQNVNIQKKERLISDEVTRNMGGTIAEQYTRLNMRKKACEQINKMFPELNVDVDYRQTIQELTDEDITGGETYNE